MASEGLLDAIERIRNTEGQVMQDTGKKYTGVSARLEALRLATGDEYGIDTDILVYPGRDGAVGDTIVMRCIIRDKADRTIATGHAEETRNSTWINETSALENCETSAIGRALAAMGIHGGEFASTNEISSANRKRAQTSPPAPPAGLNGPPPRATPAPSQRTTATSTPSMRGTSQQVTAPLNDSAIVLNTKNEGGWDTAVEAFRTFAIECNDDKELKGFWDRNRSLIDTMKAEAPLAFDEARDIFASRERYLAARASLPRNPQ